MKVCFTRLCTVLLLFVFSKFTAWAQSTAQLSGRVTDQSGAVLPGVEITATQTDTGIARNTVTNETGNYLLPNLALGPYRLEAMLPGFRSFAQTGIVLQVNSNPDTQCRTGGRPGRRDDRSFGQCCPRGNTKRWRRAGRRKRTHCGVAVKRP